MECLTCRNISGEQRISPGPFLHEGAYWLVDHAYPTSHLGWLVILLKRHAEALHDLSRTEFAELAEIQYKLAQVTHQDSHVQKEYMMLFAEAQGFSHIHIHFVPKPENLPARLKGPAIFKKLKVTKARAVPPATIQAFCEDFRARLGKL